jgi:transcription elongation factor Elf1
MNDSSKRRSLKVVQWLSSTPVFAVCTFCGREFEVPMSALSRTVDAQANLQQQFDRHTCQLEDVS